MSEPHPHYDVAEAEDTRADECPSAHITRLAARYGLTEGALVELLDEAAECGLTTSESQGLAVIEACRQLECRHRQAWHALVHYQKSQSVAADLRMSTRIMALHLGYVLAAGADNVADVARAALSYKETANKCALVFAQKVPLPKRPGQRDDTARKNQSEARKRQLKAEGTIE